MKLSRRDSYKLFLKNLPLKLAEIQDKYDHDRLTPLFRDHQKNLAYFC